MSGRPPVRARRTGGFTLPLPPEDTFDLFTAEGERRWVEGWAPKMLSDCNATKPGAVFLTDHGGEQTIWTVIEADRAAGLLLYSRVSPGRRAGTVKVALEPEANGTSVCVTYDITALAPAAEDAVRAMDEQAFAAMMAEWRRLISRALAPAQ